VFDPSIFFKQKGMRDKMIVDATWSMTYEHKPREEWGGLTHPPMIKVSERIREVVEKR
jgi:hypothetical protein